MTPTLFATPATVRALGDARAAVVLVGGYDGSGNFGDIAQFDAALELVNRLGPGVIALPLLEREFLPSHLRLTDESSVNAPFTLFLDGSGEREDGLVPIAAPRELAFGACYLYGGGYLNGSWGARKLAMLEAAENLLGAGGAEPCLYVGSGLQVEPEWIEGCASALRKLDLLGARDRRSRSALAVLAGETRVLETGDDAIGVLRRLRPSDRSSADGDVLCLNLHFAEHEWMGERPAAVLELYVGLVAELGRLAGRPLAIQPLLAYSDDRVDERPAAERLRRACAELGAEVAEPLLLRPADLAGAAPRLGEASLTVSSSYHVALTSLMLGVPALLVADNDYYEQKVTGLIEDFGLPPAFSASASDDPAAKAAALSSLLFDEGERQALRRRLAAEAGRLRERRAATEAELLGHLGGGALSTLDALAADQAERLRERSAEPAQLQAQLAALETEREELRQRAEESPLEAELRVQEAEASAARAHAELATILSSRSWRLLEPLRRLRGFLRRR